jgi:hypothetical protein
MKRSPGQTIHQRGTAGIVYPRIEVEMESTPDYMLACCSCDPRREEEELTVPRDGTIGAVAMAI